MGNLQEKGNFKFVKNFTPKKKEKKLSFSKNKLFNDKKEYAYFESKLIMIIIYN